MSEQLTQEELEFLRLAKQEGQEIIASFGQIQIERLNLNMRLSELETLQSEAEEKFKQLVAKEQTFSQKLFEKYGDAVIDIELGTIKKNN